MFRALLDTNVIISGLFWDGNERKLLTLAVEGRFRAILCEAVIMETERIIRLKQDKLPGSPESAARALSILVTASEIPPAIAEEEILEYRGRIEDRCDLAILAAAIASGAQAIVSGDKHFWTPQVEELICVLKARDLIDLVR
jgi:putative PIN family toxin of toxin-antitoxin system